MHERERHRVILSAVQDRPVVTVIDMCSLTGASEATIRRDIATLHIEKSCAASGAGQKLWLRHNLSGWQGGLSMSTKRSKSRKSKPLPALL